MLSDVAYPTDYRLLMWTLWRASGRQRDLFFPSGRAGTASMHRLTGSHSVSEVVDRPNRMLGPRVTHNDRSASGADLVKSSRTRSPGIECRRTLRRLRERGESLPSQGSH